MGSDAGRFRPLEGPLEVCSSGTMSSSAVEMAVVVSVVVVGTSAVIADMVCVFVGCHDARRLNTSCCPL